MFVKVAILLPGYLDSPDYLHFKLFDTRLTHLGYKVIRVDPCSLWKDGDSKAYSVARYLKQVKDLVESEHDAGASEIILIGHSLGGFISILAGSEDSSVTKVIALCPPASYDASLKKWKGNEERISKRDIPGSADEYKLFSIPKSFALDAMSHSAIDAIKNLTIPLMIFIGLNDTVVSPDETEQLVKAAVNPYVARKEGVGHDFRKSIEQCNEVMDEVEKFLVD